MQRDQRAPTGCVPRATTSSDGRRLVPSVLPPLGVPGLINAAVEHEDDDADDDAAARHGCKFAEAQHDSAGRRAKLRALVIAER